MTERRTRALSGLLKEGFVIFAGVMVALAADDWRQRRAELVDAEVSLSVIEADLVRDSTALADAEAATTEHYEAAAWIVSRWDGPAPPADSIQWAFFALETSPLPNFSRAGYDGLRSANRLDLFSGDLREWLTGYYEVWQPSTGEYAETVYGRREGLLSELAPYIRLQGFQPDPVTLSLVRPWTEVTANDALNTRLRRYGGSASALARQERDLLAAAIELLGQVRERLGRD